MFDSLKSPLRSAPSVRVPAGAPGSAPALTHQIPAQAMTMAPFRPSGRVSTGAGATAPAQQPTTPDLRCWAKFTRRAQDNYQGEFGFDWMEWKRDPQRRNDEITEAAGVPIADFEYCYDKQQQQYLPVAADAHLKRKLQDEYQRLLVYGEDYYAAWLSVRPNQEIKLHLRIEALNPNAAKGDYLTFGKHASYQVTVNGKVNEDIRIPVRAGTSAKMPQLEDVTIKCLHPGPDTSIRVLDEQGKVVGQLNIISNKKTYKLPVRLVYLVKDGPASAANLSALQATVVGLHLAQYLNEHSLNQAQIQVEFEKTNQVHQLVFKEAEWAGKFYDVAKKWFTNYKIVNAKTGLVKETTYFQDKVLTDYTARYEQNGTPPFRGILLVVTDIIKNPADGEGGVSRVRPVTFRQTLIYQTNIKDRTTYAHEIGHALGLDHSFLDGDSRSTPQLLAKGKNSTATLIKLLEKNKKIYDVRIKYFESTLDERKANLKQNAAYYQQHLAEKQKAEADIQQNTATLAAEKKDSLANDKLIARERRNLVEQTRNAATFAANPFKFKQGVTVNIMDYNGSVGESFFHWQWKVMQDDVRLYYGK